MLNFAKYFMQGRVCFLFVISVAGLGAMQENKKYQIHKKNKSSDFGSTGITTDNLKDTNKNSSHSSENDIEKEDSKKKTQIIKKKNLHESFDKKIESLACKGCLKEKEYQEIKIRSLIIRKVLHELRDYLTSEIFSNDIQFAKVCCAINDEYLSAFYFAEKIYGSPFLYPENEQIRKDCVIKQIKSAFLTKNEYRIFFKEEEN